MTLRLEHFPVVPGGGTIGFHDSFHDIRPRSNLEHQAIDLFAPTGTPVVSTTTGRICYSWITKKNHAWRKGCGWTDAGGFIVIVIDDNEYVHYYAHLNRGPLVVAPERVVPGTPLGEVGNTGSIAAGSAPHLHYQVWEVRGRGEERKNGAFTRPFGSAVNSYSELRRLAVSLGASVRRRSTQITIP